MGVPHAVCIPFPAQGHINPMLQFAKLLHTKYGFHITFVNSIYNHNRYLKSRGPRSLDGLPGFCFESIPDGLRGLAIDGATQDIADLCRSTSTTSVSPFRDLIARLNQDGPPVTCIVSDGAMIFTMKVAEELGIPEVVFWTMSACGFMGYVQYRTVIDNGLFPLKDASYLTNGFLDTPVDWIPEKRNIRLKDLPSFIRTTDPDEYMVKFMVREVEASSRASAIILNTFEALEHKVLNYLSSMQHLKLPPIYPIGPLELLVDQIIPNEDPVNSIGSSLWKDEEECIDWLDSQEPNSVLYVNFGSITVMTLEQFLEFAWGLAYSKKNFLWVIKPDIVREDSLELPQEFVDETKDRGMLASWCPQNDVLKHKSLGGFLTHCGWNSTLESISWGGVPLLCWPFFAEQQMNCHYSCVEWEIGTEIESNVKRKDVEKLVRVLMEDGKGKEMKRRAIQWKNEAEEAARPEGSSYKNLDKLVAEVLLC